MNGKGKGVFKIIKLRNYKIISFCIDKHFNSNIIVVIQVQFSLKVNSVKTKLVKYLSSNISLKKKNKHILFNFPQQSKPCSRGNFFLKAYYIFVIAKKSELVVKVSESVIN